MTAAREAQAALVPLIAEASSRPCRAGASALTWAGDDGFALRLTLQLPSRPTGTRSVPAIVHVQVTAQRLGRWRREHDLPAEQGSVLSVPLGLLTSRAQGRRWEIGDPQRDRTAQEIADAVEEHALPLLALLQEPEAACPLLARDLWGISARLPEDVAPPPVDYLLCWGRDDLVGEMVAQARTVARFRQDLAGPHPCDWVELARSVGAV
ncbi:hypothetical protein [Brachybacterium phenoliresistens]|uniref:hypothetical protein n=1 Tax=Brachybacterium phenoliresistens TaxID=396014 RepID=UPI0031D4FDFF